MQRKRENRDSAQGTNEGKDWIGESIDFMEGNSGR